MASEHLDPDVKQRLQDLVDAVQLLVLVTGRGLATSASSDEYRAYREMDDAARTVLTAARAFKSAMEAKAAIPPVRR